MHILDEIGLRHDAEVARAREEGYQAGHKEGLREGYSSRVKDEVAARRRGSRVTAWSCALCEDNQIELTLTGNRLDYDDADQIAATLIYHLNTIRAREFNDQEEERND